MILLEIKNVFRVVMRLVTVKIVYLKLIALNTKKHIVFPKIKHNVYKIV